MRFWLQSEIPHWYCPPHHVNTSCHTGLLLAPNFTPPCRSLDLVARVLLFCFDVTGVNLEERRFDLTKSYRVRLQFQKVGCSTFHEFVSLSKFKLSLSSADCVSYGHQSGRHVVADGCRKCSHCQSKWKQYVWVVLSGHYG